MPKRYIVVRQNKYARVLSFAKGATYIVLEKVDNKWEEVALGHGSSYRPVALSVYKRLTTKRTARG